MVFAYATPSPPPPVVLVVSLLISISSNTDKKKLVRNSAHYLSPRAQSISTNQNTIGLWQRKTPIAKNLAFSCKSQAIRALSGNRCRDFFVAGRSHVHLFCPCVEHELLNVFSCNSRTCRRSRPSIMAHHRLRLSLVLPDAISGKVTRG